MVIFENLPVLCFGKWRQTAG